MSLSRDAARSAVIAGLALAAVAWVIYAALVLVGVSSTRAEFDAQVYHLVVIESFAATWPAADVSDYLSATTPGYHWLLAGVWRVWSSATVVGVANAGVAGLLVGALGWWSARISGVRWAWVAALPLAASPYAVQAGVSVLPDNAGWLCVLCVLALCLGGPAGLRWVAVGLAMLALVLMRQSHIWAAGLIVAAGWLGPAGALLPRRERLAADARSKLAGAVIGGASVVPAVVALALFVWIWGGLVPPTFAGQSGGEHPNVRASLSLVAPAYILMLIGLYGPFFSGWWWPGIRARLRLSLVCAAAGGGVGLALALVGPSTFDLDAGRNGGYWQIIRAGPVIADRTSVALVVLSCWGGMTAGVCGAALPARRRWLLLVALAGFASAQVVNANTWQRYYEPFVLMLIGVASACCLRGDADGRSSLPALPDPVVVRIWRVAGPMVLTVGLAGLTATTLSRGG